MDRLAEFVKERSTTFGEPLEKIKDTPVVVHGYTTTQGRYGTLYIMDVELADGTKMKVYTGAKVITYALEKALEANAFPLVATFVRKKNYWYVE